MNKNTLAALALIAIITYGCSKYDDGPAFSLRTKKGRLTGEWELDKINGDNPEDYYTGSGSSIVYNEYKVTWTFDRDGEYEACYEYDYQVYVYDYWGSYWSNYQDSDCQDGEWEFEDNGEELEIDPDESMWENSSYEINRLTSNELWVETSGGNEFEFKKN